MRGTKPVCWRTRGETTGAYRYHTNEPVGLVSEALYSEEYVSWLRKQLVFKDSQLDKISNLANLELLK